MKGGGSVPDRGARSFLERMFEEMVILKDASRIPDFYHPDFVLFTNGREQSYEEFAEGHRAVYASEITYEVEYDQDSWIETANSGSVRMWITTARPDQDPTRIELVLIVKMREGLIHRLWETTWPDWSDLSEFETY